MGYNMSLRTECTQYVSPRNVKFKFRKNHLLRQSNENLKKKKKTRMIFINPIYFLRIYSTQGIVLNTGDTKVN